MSFFYKPIEIENFETLRKGLLASYPVAQKHTKLFYPEEKLDFFLKIPEAVEIFERYKIREFLIPKGCAFIRINPKNSVPIHTDTNPELRYSFNIPLTDCSGSILEFFTSEIPGMPAVTQNGLVYTSYDINRCKLELKTPITGPFIMDTHMLHGVTNDSDKTSILLLIRLNHEITDITDQYF